MTPVNRPAQQHKDPKLGVMVYNSDDDCWLGNYNCYEYRIAGVQSQPPCPELLRYCFDTLAKKAWLTATLQQQKDQIKPTSDPALHTEIDDLSYLNLLFYRRENELRLLAQLATSKGEQDNEDKRLWHMEFSGGVCEGLAFYT